MDFQPSGFVIVIWPTVDNDADRILLSCGIRLWTVQLEWDEILAAKFKEVITEHIQTVYFSRG